MKSFLLILSLAFTILTFIGATYVLISDGAVNAGYAVIPMVFTLASFTGYKKNKSKEK